MAVLDLTKRVEKGSPISTIEHDQNFTDIETQVNLNTAGATGGSSKLDATTAPSVNDDSNEGYGIGSLWVDISADKSYVCLDATVGAAVWKQTSIVDHTELSNIGTNTHAQIDTGLTDHETRIADNETHVALTSGNPHAVTKTELSLSNVTDDEQLKKGTQWNADISEKATPVNADLILSEDSTASFVKKKSTWTQIKAFLKTYFDGLYSTLTHAAQHTDGDDDIQNATADVKGLATAAQITKLDAIEAEATKYPDTGEQAFLDADHTKLDGIATAATKYPDTGEQAFLDADHTKLDGIATAATKYPDTGEQAFLDADHTKLDAIEASADMTDAVNIASSIVGTAAKATPVDADTVPLIDSADASSLKEVLWSQIKATLKTYFDTLYQAVNTAILKSLVDAKGDILVATADNTPARLAVGANDKVLMADSNEATGVKWETPAGGGDVTAGANITDKAIVIGDGGAKGIKTGINLTGQGDLLYASAANVLARLAKGAVNTKLFINAAGTIPEWAVGMKIGTFTKSTGDASGTNNYTGIGFKPSHVIFIAAVNSNIRMSVGFDDGTLHYNIADNHVNNANTYGTNATNSIIAYQSAGFAAFYTGEISVLGSDGFTINWTKYGAVTEDFVVRYFAFR